MDQAMRVKVDPIVWTKNERSFATPMQVCLTRNCDCTCGFRALTVLPSRRVKRRLALLASIQPRDNPAEGTPMALGPCVYPARGLFLPIGYLSHAS
jgi:hypothetical protein